MKKHLTTFLSIAVMALMAFTTSSMLTSCSEEDNVPQTEYPSKQTIFSMENDGTRSVTIIHEDGTPVSEGTRTSIDPDRWFYWEKGDKIWVKDGNAYYSSIGSNVVTKQEEGKFVVDASLGKEEYPVFYTGYLNGDTAQTMSSHVTIAATQTQSAWDNASHLGTSGDCGVATATKRADGTYKFHLYHKAHYLIFQPYISPQLLGEYKLTKIEIIANGTTLAGSYNFDAVNGLGTTPTPTGSTASNSVTLNCTNSFVLPKSPLNYCYAVIQPGTHTLEMKYTVAPTPETGSAYESSATVTFTKEITSREYKSGFAMTIRHELGTPDYLVYSRKFYMWDAPLSQTYVFGNENYNPIEAPTPATQSCAMMPNANEVYWYITSGDPRWDGEIRWKLEGDETIYTGGVWLKKKNQIVAEGLTFSSTVGHGGVDMRRTAVESTNLATDRYYTAGEPSTDEKYKYFFLPAFGMYMYSSGVYATGAGRYWTSSTYPGYNNIAYDFQFGPTSIAIPRGYKTYGIVAGDKWFK